MGSGAFATVWLAYDDELRARVAVKVLADNWTHRADVRLRFRQEAQFMRSVDSDRLVRVLDVGELPDGRPYLVMPFADGGTLADRLTAGPLPGGQAVTVAAEIARAVAVLHDGGILHRDLTPSNVVFSTTAGQERVLVADLGLAKALAQASGLTLMVGTPGYTAPEQHIPGAALDARADVYALGALAHHMLTGRPPGAVAAGPPPRIPAAVDRVVRRALHRDPRRRWASAAAFAAALDTVAGPAATAGPVLSRRDTWVSRVLRVPAVAAVTAAVLTVGGDAPARFAPAGWTQVDERRGAISVLVPQDWAGQLKDAGWDPTVVRLPAGRMSALLVGPNLAVWPDEYSGVPGLFVGLGRKPGAGDAPVLPIHLACTREPARALTLPGFTGSVQRWTGCAGTSVSFSEVLLTPNGLDLVVYVQVKQTGGPDRTGEILPGIRVFHRSMAGT